MRRQVRSGQIAIWLETLVYIISGNANAGCRYLGIPSPEAVTDDNVAK